MKNVEKDKGSSQCKMEEDTKLKNKLMDARKILILVVIVIFVVVLILIAIISKENESTNVGAKKEIEHNWIRNEDLLKCDNCGLEFKIGDYVDYKPDKVDTEIVITAEESGISEAKEEFEYHGSEDDEIQRFKQKEETYWRVIGVEDSEGNGTNETLLIKMDNLSGQELYLAGRAAYNNGPYIMDKICKELYSSDEYGEARSINVNDVNKTFNYTPTGGMYFENGVLKEVSGFNTNIESLSIWNTIKTNANAMPLGEDEISLGKYKINGYYYSCDQIFENIVIENPVTGELTDITETAMETIFYDKLEEKITSYWLACRGNLVLEYGIIGVGPGVINEKEVYSWSNALTSAAHPESIKAQILRTVDMLDGESFYVCPVISLKTKIPKKIEMPYKKTETINREVEKVIKDFINAIDEKEWKKAIDCFDLYRSRGLV